MKPASQRLLDELRYYASQLDVIGSVLIDLIRLKKHQEFTTQAAEVYQLLTFDLIDTYNSLKRALRGEGYSLGGEAKRPSLRQLEEMFIVLRDAAELAESKAEKVSGYRTRQARVSRESADRIISLAENAAKILVAEANKEGRWTVEWERRLGLRRWLR
jgi:hypothetical protein